MCVAFQRTFPLPSQRLGNFSPRRRRRRPGEEKWASVIYHLWCLVLSTRMIIDDRMTLITTYQQKLLHFKHTIALLDHLSSRTYSKQVSLSTAIYITRSQSEILYVCVNVYVARTQCRRLSFKLNCLIPRGLFCEWCVFVYFSVCFICLVRSLFAPDFNT